jgi:hypothetical protein
MVERFAIEWWGDLTDRSGLAQELVVGVQSDPAALVCEALWWTYRLVGVVATQRLRANSAVESKLSGSP